MELQRPRDGAQQPSIGVFSEEPELSALAPPPAPFPTELLAPELQTRVAAPAGGRELRADLGAVQQSCINALHTLLPDDEPASSSSTTTTPSTWTSHDRHLAAALTELLEVTYEIEALRPASSSTASTRHPSPATRTRPLPTEEVEQSYAALAQHLTDLQHAASMQRSADGVGRELHPAVHAVREELAWERVESLSRAVVELVRAREPGGLSREEDAGMPPSYTQVDGGDDNTDLPSYHDHLDHQHQHSEATKFDTTKPSSTSAAPHGEREEKMMRELASVTGAIERLYALAPRLQDQRVEMRVAGPSRQKRESDKMRELEEIWDKIERAHGMGRERAERQRSEAFGLDGGSRARRERFLDGLLENGERRRLSGQDSTMRKVDAEMAKARDLRDRDLFLRGLVDSADGGRLADQDADGLMDGDAVSIRQQAVLADLIERARHSRLESQDFPGSVEDKLAERRENLIGDIVAYGSSGRLVDQDSLPPTPRSHSRALDLGGEPGEIVSAQRFLRDSTAPGSSNGQHQTTTRSRSNSVPLDVGVGEKRGSIATIKKIKGMVRRSSIGLGLGPKIPTTDLSGPSYIAEYQENLHILQVMLHGVGLALANTDWTVETFSSADDTAALVTSKKDPAIMLRLTLPVSTTPNQRQSFSAQDGYLAAKLAAQPASSSAPTSATFNTIPQALSATDLRSLRPTSICCAVCMGEVADVRGKAYKDLPSEHWAEMMEVWMCHQDAGFTQGLAEKTKEGFWPSEGNVLVGANYLLVHETGIQRDAVVLEDTPADAAWQAVSCACGEILGKKRVEDGKAGAGAVRLSKWAISVVQDDDDERAGTTSYPLSVFVAADMLELAQAHASYRFIIADEEPSQRRIYVWLFNPSLRISYRRGSNASSPLPSPLRSSFTRTRSSASLRSVASLAALEAVNTMRAAKVMYRVTDGHGHGDHESALPGFGPGGQVEQLMYPRGVVSRLIDVLRESTGAFPPARRTMGVFDVGFLERL